MTEYMRYSPLTKDKNNKTLQNVKKYFGCVKYINCKNYDGEPINNCTTHRTDNKTNCT